MSTIQYPAGTGHLYVPKAQWEAAAKERDALRSVIEHIQRVSAPGGRTLDDFMRDMGYINDRVRAALLSPRTEGAVQ